MTEWTRNQKILVSGAIATAFMATFTAWLAWETHRSIDILIEQSQPKLIVGLDIPLKVNPEYWKYYDIDFPLTLTNIGKTNIVIRNILVTSNCIDVAISFMREDDVIILTQNEPFYKLENKSIIKRFFEEDSELPCKFNILVVGVEKVWKESFELVSMNQ